MYSVYILKSLKNNFIYVGSTEDVTKRLNLHNSGKVRSTQAYKPWELIETRVFTTRAEALKEEYFLKTGQQKEQLRRKYAYL